MLLQPALHAAATPQLRNRVAGLLLQACKMAGGRELFTAELLPQLLPVFTCTPALRAAYGSSLPPPQPQPPQPGDAGGDGDGAATPDPYDLEAAISNAQRAAGARAAGRGGGWPSVFAAGALGLLRPAAATVDDTEDSGYWDLVYILYPEAIDAVGPDALRDAVPNWSNLETTLMVIFCVPEERFAWPTSLDRELLI